jgi:flavin-dependent dehydrogenase
MGRKTDVFVIGGGPAGLAAAIAASQRGFQVIVADGAKPPIDKACGEGLMPSTLAALRQLGITISPEDGRNFRGIRFLDGQISAEANFPANSGVGVRRTVLHQRMVEQAEACGVSFLWNTPVSGISPEGVFAAGSFYSARWIIGADGNRSRVRRWSGLAAHTYKDWRVAFRRHYRVKPWTEFMEIHWGREMQAYVTPLGTEEICVALISRDPNVRLEALWREFPELTANLENATPVSTERGAITGTHQLECVYSGNIALIGDASGSIDAITGEGLCLGFQQALALANALEAGELSLYQEEHRRLARRPTQMARLLLSLDGRPALRRRVLRALATDPNVFARLLSVHIGVTSAPHCAMTGALFGWRFLTA